MKADSTREKFFFDFFMLRRLESVFQGQKIFFEKIFFEKFWSVWRRVITIHQKVPRDIFIYNVEKFKLLA